MKYLPIRRATVLACGILAASASFAGTITGTIKFEGEAPPMLPVQGLTADPACAAMHKDAPILNEALVLGDGQTMANVVVSVSKGLTETVFPAPAEPMTVTQKGCQFAPHVFAIQAGQPVKMLNPDGILHNVNVLSKLKADNKAMPKELPELELKFDKAEEPFQIVCNVHAWMRAYCAVFEHPFFSVTAKDGVFKIDGLPAGEYEITAWHERLGKQMATVTVADGPPASHDFTFSRPAKAGSKKD
jgi:plastocyanin